MDSRFHGVSTREFNQVPRPVEIIDFSYFGLIGTAPNADAENWPLNTPILITGPNNVPAGLGSAGTLRDALDGIFDQAGGQGVIVRVEEGASVAATMSNIIGDRLLGTGMHAFTAAFPELGIKPRLLCAPGFTSQRPADGIASATVSNGGAGYTEATVTLEAGEGGTVPLGAKLRTLIEDGAITEIIIDNPGSGGEAPVDVVITGDGDDAAASVTIGQVANPVAAEFLGIANRLRACVGIDGPNTTPEAAVQHRMDWATDRFMIVDPHVKVFRDGETVVEPPSARLVGLQVRVDRERGFWHSPSNKEIFGIVGTARPITWGLSDPDTEAEYLNDHDVTTIIRNINAGGFKLWGNRTTSDDPLKAFWSVRRTHDVVIESIERASMIFVDEPFSVDLLVNIGETASSFLRQLRARGAIIGSRVWLDTELNTPETFVAGQLFVSYDAEGPAPAEHIIFHFYRNTGYYRELAEEAARELARLAA